MPPKPAHRVSTGERSNIHEPAGRLQGELGSRGIRLTRQRRVVLQVIESAPSHLDAGEILDRAQKIDRDITRVGHEETRKLLLRDDDPARPAPEETFQDRRTLEIGGERIELAWHGSNHSPDNIFIHLPDHAALMLVDIVNPGWAAVCQSNLADDVPGYIEAVGTALTYPWRHFIGGHWGRLGSRDDIVTHRQYMADIADSSRKALDTVDPTPYFVKHGEDTWAAVRDYLDATTAAAAAPVIEKYTGVLAAAEVFTAGTTFHVMQSIRLDLGYGSQVHP